MITDQQIDHEILAQSDVRTRKVARIVAFTARALGQESEEFLERIARRIEWLCENGKLEGLGNLKRWRHSEVRLLPP